jgi:hypothetical protein
MKWPLTMLMAPFAVVNFNAAWRLTPFSPVDMACPPLLPLTQLSPTCCVSSAGIDAVTLPHVYISIVN